MINLKALDDAIAASGLKRQFIADKIGITRYSLLNKLKGKTEFTASEMHTLRVVLRMNLRDFNRIFFASDVN